MRQKIESVGVGEKAWLFVAVGYSPWDSLRPHYAAFWSIYSSREKAQRAAKRYWASQVRKRNPHVRQQSLRVYELDDEEYMMLAFGKSLDQPDWTALSRAAVLSALIGRREAGDAEHD